ncbi:MAG TPA: hypothetical protein PKD28_04385 [Candidatus Saccharibacteria bacterium]|nr:hypothetical protein [Candidatus Saccharibacteria bacterium]
MARQAKKRATTTKKPTSAVKKRPLGNKGKKDSRKKQGVIAGIRQKIHSFLGRRPHRSFRLTRRRDYKRSLALPGYWSFTGSVLRVLRQNKKLFISLAIVYAIINVLVVGISSQESFVTLQEGIAEAGHEVYEGNWSALGTAAILTVSTLAGKITPNISEAQQIYAVLLGLLVWLTTVWILRQRMAGHVVRLRDGLYSAGAPIVSTFIVTIFMVLHLLPIMLVAIGYVAAKNTGLLDGGVEAMLFWVVAGGLATLSLYWIATSVLAMIVVTLPGMYPMRAMKIAGDMVIGRRLRILLRIMWMLLLLAVMWIVILIPVILMSIWIENAIPILQWIPIVPLSILGLTTVSVIWIASYAYVLYRKIVEDDADPA